MKYTVLFVDDETRILERMKRQLEPFRDEFDYRFASSGSDALAMLAQGSYHVIVADMIMPGMNGAELLAEAKRRHPEVVRMILSAHAERENAMRAVPVAHQFLSKPCHPDRLNEVIRRSADLRLLLAENELAGIVGNVGSLPSPPAIFTSLTQTLADPDSSIRDVAGIVEQDPAMVAKVLQLVNSAFFGLGRHLNTIQDAVGFLGMKMIRNLTLSLKVFHSFGDDFPKGFDPEAERHHTLTVANLTRSIIREESVRDDAFLAGILHDIGKLLIATRRKEEFGEMIRESSETGVPLVVLEAKNWEITHAQIGAYLLGIWGIPLAIVEAVAHHHFPARVKSKDFDLVGALWLSNQLIHEQTGDRLSTKDLEYLQQYKLVHALDEWRYVAEGSVEETA